MTKNIIATATDTNGNKYSFEMFAIKKDGRITPMLKNKDFNTQKEKYIKEGYEIIL